MKNACRQPDSVRNRRPASVSGLLESFGREEDFLGEMLHDARD